MLSCICLFDFIPVEAAQVQSLPVLTTLDTKQAEDTPKSLSKSDRAHVVR
jgi:hypothetical protein